MQQQEAHMSEIEQQVKICANKLADFTLLPEDILGIEPERVAEVKVMLTMVDGRIVYTS